MREHSLEAGDIEKITLYAAKNILGPIRYTFARTELEGKFCMHFLLAAIAVAGRAGKAEFTDDFVARADVSDMQRRVETIDDPEIEAMGFERIRSRIVVETKSGKKIERWADENYRGSPHNPLSDEELEGKFRDCAAGLIGDAATGAVLQRIWHLEDEANPADLLDLIAWRGTAQDARSVAS
jgi:2-methylcitrate dehydratase PrpD